jgi:alpha-L-arabinofuranosidase
LFKHDTTAVRHLRNLSPNVLRWPGGNLSNDYFWNAKTAADLPDDLPGTKYWLGSDPTTKDATTPDYYKTLEETNATGSICVNYSYARYGLSDNSVQRAAHLAAEWVRHDKGRTRFWEIGNENFGNWQSGYEIDPAKYTDGRPRFISGDIYGAHCNVFIDSMRTAAEEVGAEIYIGVQAWESLTSWDPIQTAWNDGVFPQVGNKADFLVLHNYFTPYQARFRYPDNFWNTEKYSSLY